MITPAAVTRPVWGNRDNTARSDGKKHSLRFLRYLLFEAAPLSAQQVLEELPDLELEDTKACLQYASRKLNHPVLVRA
jgi:hypothetical protein